MRNLRENIFKKISFYKKNITKNYKIRYYKNILNKKVIPSAIKYSILLIMVISALIISLKLFNPQLLNKLYSNSSSYILKSLNIKSESFKNIDISGNERVSKEEIIATINKSLIIFSKTGGDIPLIEFLAKEIKNNHGWVNKINISRTLPNNLNILITEYKPFALMHNGLDKFIIDKDGNKVKISDDSQFEGMIILSGDNANLNIKSLFNIMAINPKISSGLYSATWVGNRRWDIRFENGLLVKLPSDNIEEAWQNLIKIYQSDKIIENIRLIDLRIKGKTYLETKK